MIPALEQKIMKCKFFYSICDFGKFVQVRVSVRACVCVHVCDKRGRMGGKEIGRDGVKVCW